MCAFASIAARYFDGAEPAIVRLVCAAIAVLLTMLSRCASSMWFAPHQCCGKMWWMSVPRRAQPPRDYGQRLSGVIEITAPVFGFITTVREEVGIKLS